MFFVAAETSCGICSCAVEKAKIARKSVLSVAFSNSDAFLLLLAMMLCVICMYGDRYLTSVGDKYVQNKIRTQHSKFIISRVHMNVSD